MIVLFFEADPNPALNCRGFFTCKPRYFAARIFKRRPEKIGSVMLPLIEYMIILQILINVEHTLHEYINL